MAQFNGNAIKSITNEFVQNIKNVDELKKVNIKGSRPLIQ